MKPPAFLLHAPGKRLLPALVVFAVFAFAGCVTPKIDWSARVGDYTYDQALAELGPPDKSAKLSDGSVVAEWMTQSGRTVITPTPHFMQPGRYYGSFTPQYSGTYEPPHYLQLTFGAAGRLEAWKTFIK